MATAKRPKDTLSQGLSRLRTEFGKRAEGALYRVGQKVMSDSKQNYVPVDFGVLKNSGFVDKPVTLGRKITIELSYGGAASAYALAVHEHPSEYSPPSWMHKLGGYTVVRNDGTSDAGVTFSPSGTGPKYLERPLMAAVGTMARDLADDLKFIGYASKKV